MQTYTIVNFTPMNEVLSWLLQYQPVRSWFFNKPILGPKQEKENDPAALQKVKSHLGTDEISPGEKTKTSLADSKNIRVFIDAAPPDMPLANQLEKLLGTTFNYSLPIDFSKEPSEIRENLERNLKSCDVVIILYGHTSYPWLQAQLSYCRRILADRAQPLKVVVCNLSSPTKPPLGSIISNVRILEGSTLQACLPSIKEILTNG